MVASGLVSSSSSLGACSTIYIQWGAVVRADAALPRAMAIDSRCLNHAVSRRSSVRTDMDRYHSFAGPVAQSVERRIPRGESTRPEYKGPGFEARRVLDVYEPPGGYGYGWWQAVARRSQ